MSAIATVIGQGVADASVHALLDASRARGNDVRAVRSTEAAVLGCSRAAWEMGPSADAETLIAEEDGVVVVADATLYYLADLGRALEAAGVTLRGWSAAHYIAAAYRAWGDACVPKLEGDFVFIVWDVRRHRVLLARDPHGSRPLFYTRVHDRLVAGSSLSGVAAHPGVSTALNLAALAEDVASIASVVLDETAYSSVSRLPAGHMLRWTPGTAPVIERFWSPPFFEQGNGLPFERAAEELRNLLLCAVSERRAETGPTAVWMSGGYDSTAVFAAGKVSGHEVIPVSVSYPVGDAGREDELILQVAQRWNADVSWVPSGSMAREGDVLSWGRRRDEPVAHAFEPWNRALVAATVARGARVALNGNGGDQFFAVSPVVLADLLAAGDWSTLLRERQALGIRGLQTLLYWTVVPWLSGWGRQAVASVRGQAPRHYLEDAVPRWMPAAAVKQTHLLERRRPPEFRRRGETHGSAESAWYLLGAFGPRIIATACGIALEGGVETRSPLYDRRIIDFAARRPREERLSLGEKKRLLRASMRGLLPDEVLAARPRRTGLPGTWLREQLLALLPPIVASMQRECRLADLGLIEPGVLLEDWELFTRAPEREARRGGGVFHAVAAECWLRARVVPQAGTEWPALVA